MTGKTARWRTLSVADATVVAAGQFEWNAIVVAFVFILPAHTIFALTLGGFIVMWQTEVFLAHLGELGSQYDAPGVAGPMFGIQCGIVNGQVVVAGIAKNGFHKIEVADQATWCKETDFHAFVGDHTFHLGANNGAQQQ